MTAILCNFGAAMAIVYSEESCLITKVEDGIVSILKRGAENKKLENPNTHHKHNLSNLCGF